MYKYIDKVGVELEGGWRERPDDLGTDISVKILPADVLNCDHPCHCSVCFPVGCDCASLYTGEVRSRPYKSLHILKWMKDSYPDFINSTCGMHIHLSFKSKKSYVTLMEPRFYATFLREVEIFASKHIPKNHYFWKRLIGEEKYCKRMFTPEAQANEHGKPETRRTHLNYCYALHGTLENRLFPMFEDVHLAIKCLKWYIGFVETYVENHLETVVIERTIDIPVEKSNNLFTILDEIPDLFERSEATCV